MPFTDADTYMTGLPRAPQTVGSGMLQSAAEILRLRPYWENEYVNGVTDKQFSDWVRDPDVMDRYANAPKIMQR